MNGVSMDIKKLDELREYCKTFPGVDIHGKSIRISFFYRSVRCLESIKGIPISKTNIKFAANKRATILHEIATDRFNYRDHFPESKRAELFSKSKYIPKVGELLDKWLKLSKSKDRPKTYQNNKYRADNYILPKFGDDKVDQVTQSKIKDWIAVDLAHLSNKTINEVLIPIRGAFASAAADRVIDFNPFDHIKNLKRVKSDNCDPFTRKEIKSISDTETYKTSERNAAIFNIWSGLRISELLALAWEDIDLDNKQINVKRGVVRGKFSATKTDGSTRTVDLLDDAYTALLAQRAISQRLAPEDVEITLSDNKTVVKESLRFVFINSNTQRHFYDSENFNSSFFKNHLEKAKVRHRGANQARHTFASQLLTAEIPERWIAKQMGHTSIAMLEKHYAKWMNEEMPEMAKKVSKKLKMESERSPHDPNKKGASVSA